MNTDARRPEYPGCAPRKLIRVEIPASRTYRLPGNPDVWAYVSETGRLVVSTGPMSWMYLYPHEEEAWKRSNSPSS